jgi:uroporphyrin-III C-methyltransferase/precorrin-2 dehydrogenase/sirohydrochlorin ferrochelatase
MNQLPIFMNMQGRSVLVVGSTAAAAAKARLALKAQAVVCLVTGRADQVAGTDLAAFAAEHGLTIAQRAVRQDDFVGLALAYVATGDEAADRELADWAERHGVLVNVVDRPDLCSFTTPAVVDRSPIVIAVGTGGAAPVLAQRVRAAIDRLLPSRLGAVAALAEGFRPTVRAVLPEGVARRRFWQRFFDGPAAQAALNGDEATARMQAVRLLNQDDQPMTENGAVALVAIGPGDPELLTLKAHRLLLAADVILHHGGPEVSVLELARRDADVVSLLGEDSADQVARMIALAEQGKAVVHLSPGAEVPQAIAQALREAGIQVFDVPGVALGASDGQTQALLPQEQDEARPASLLEMAFPLPFLANH